MERPSPAVIALAAAILTLPLAGALPIPGSDLPLVEAGDGYNAGWKSLRIAPRGDGFMVAVEATSDAGLISAGLFLYRGTTFEKGYVLSISQEARSLVRVQGDTVTVEHGTSVTGPITVTLEIELPADWVTAPEYSVIAWAAGDVSDWQWRVHGGGAVEITGALEGENVAFAFGHHMPAAASVTGPLRPVRPELLVAGEQPFVAENGIVGFFGVAVPFGADVPPGYVTALSSGTLAPTRYCVTICNFREVVGASAIKPGDHRFHATGGGVHFNPDTAVILSVADARLPPSAP